MTVAAQKLIPLVGESITTCLWGGYSVENPTLNHFYALHYLIPFLSSPWWRCI
jgi:quinol-cytochrome oxidoreductase complex cytochrome b subunit